MLNPALNVPEENQRKRRSRGSESVMKERKRLKISGAEYKNYRADVVPARKKQKIFGFGNQMFIKINICQRNVI